MYVKVYLKEIRFVNNFVKYFLSFKWKYNDYLKEIFIIKDIDLKKKINKCFYIFDVCIFYNLINV